MDDTIVLCVHLELGKPEFCAVAVKSVYLLTSHRVSSGLVLIMCLNVMVGHAEHLLGSEYFHSTLAQTVESLWRGNLMAVKPVDV